MMSKHDIKIYFILYHAFFILSDDSLLPYLLPYIEKSHQMMTFQREQKLSSLYFKHLNVFFKQFIKETVCVFKKGFEYFGFQVYCIFEMIFNFRI